LNWKWMTIMHNIVIVSLTKWLRRKTTIFITRMFRLTCYMVFSIIYFIRFAGDHGSTG
jgi:hypothetical protein